MKKEIKAFKVGDRVASLPHSRPKYLRGATFLVERVDPVGGFAQVSYTDKDGERSRRYYRFDEIQEAR